MIKSMTGYGSAEKIDFGKRISIEIRCVNHRYSDINVKTPRSYGYLEEVVRKCLSGYIARGKADIYITVEGISGDDGQVVLNTEIAHGYYNALQKLNEEFSFVEKICLSQISKFSDVFSVKRAEEDNDNIIRLACEVACDAGESFDLMRIKEGEKLFEDLKNQESIILGFVNDIEARAPKIAQEYANRLETRLREILGNTPIDENRLLNEIAVFADRIDVNEEIIRLRSHLSQLSELLNSEEPVGRKLDFLIQEMNREINTIGSKSNDIEVARIVIDVKSAIEKLREQAQNVV